MMCLVSHAHQAHFCCVTVGAWARRDNIDRHEEFTIEPGSGGEDADFARRVITAI